MPEDVQTGVVLDGRYRLGERIGRGGMADVYRAEDLQRGAEVAVKVFRPEVADAVDPKRIARETRFLAGAQHPALVSVLDASGPEASTAYLVMELVQGANLAETLDRGALDSEHARRILADVAGALALLHERKLVHRDVKPGNILVLDADADAGIAAKLADLGIAVGLDETRLTATNAILGTAAYLSPEQVQGHTVGPASDVYALGLVLIESLTGERAFAGGLVESAIARLNRPPTLPPDASPALATLLARMTALDPAARPQAAEVAEVLTSLRGGMTAPDFPVTAPLARATVSAEAPTAELAAPATHRVARRRRPLRVVPVAVAAAVGVVLVSGMTLLPQWQGGTADSAAARSTPSAASAPRTAAPRTTPSAAASGTPAASGTRAPSSGAVAQAALVAHTATTAPVTTSSTSASRTRTSAKAPAARSTNPGRGSHEGPSSRHAPAAHRAPDAHGASRPESGHSTASHRR
ncbi:MAG: protein kinase [Acidobacteria bacterium]|nr:protein kinase [Acidobacteriota bacterium]